MSWNVPSDWNLYYLACGCHESNGGCDCDDREFPVEDAERTWLAKSYDFDEDHGTWVKTISVKHHTARRDHKDGRVLKGDRYRVETQRCIQDDTGDSWITQEKRVLKNAIQIANSS
jgi:hypothetical protein